MMNTTMWPMLDKCADFFFHCSDTIFSIRYTFISQLRDMHTIINVKVSSVI